MYTDIATYICMYMQENIHAYIYAYMQTYVDCIHLHTHAYIDINSFKHTAIANF